MKKLLALLALLLTAPANAQLLAVCDQATAALCNTTSNPGTGTSGDPVWLMAGKFNSDFTNLWPLLSGGIIAGTNITVSGTWPNQTVSASGSLGIGFNNVSSGTNTTAAMVVGTGSSMAASGTGVIAATSLGSLSGLPVQAADTIVCNGVATTAAPTACAVAGNITFNSAGALTTSQPIDPNNGGACIVSAYTVFASDAGALLTFCNSSAEAVTLPVHTTSGFGAKYSLDTWNYGTGTVTFTPTTDTINNGQTSFAEPPNTGCTFSINGSGNWDLSACSAAGGSGGSGTVNSGTASLPAYYPATGTAVSPVGGLDFYVVPPINTASVAAAGAAANAAGAGTVWIPVSPSITAGNFQVGTQYIIQVVGTTSFTSIGASSNTVGVVFTATGAGLGTGVALQPWIVDGLTPYPNVHYRGVAGSSYSQQNATVAAGQGVNGTVLMPTTPYSVDAVDWNAAPAPTVAATALVIGDYYTIVTPGSTTWTSLGAAANTAGTVFTCNASCPGTGTGTAQLTPEAGVGWFFGQQPGFTGALVGFGLEDLSLMYYRTAIHIGDLWEPGCYSCTFKNIQISQEQTWAFFTENDEGNMTIDRAILIPGALGGGLWVGASGAAALNQPGNWNLNHVFVSDSSNSLKIRGAVFAARTGTTSTQGSSLNDMHVFDLEVNQEGRTKYTAQDGMTMSNASCLITYPTTGTPSAFTHSTIAVDMPIVFTNTPAGSPFTANTPYFIVNVATSNFQVSNLKGGICLPATAGVSGLNGTEDGFELLEFVGYPDSAGTLVNTIQPADFHGIDLECNSSAACTSIVFEQATRGVKLQANYYDAGDIATVVVRDGGGGDSFDGNSNQSYNPIGTVLDSDSSGDSLSFLITGPRNSVYAYNGSGGSTGIGLDTLAWNSVDPRCQASTGILFLTGITRADACSNKNINQVEWDNYPIAAESWTVGNGGTIVYSTSNVTYNGAGGGSSSIYQIPTNGDGALIFADNSSSGTWTINAQGGQNIVAGGVSATSYTVPANSAVWFKAAYNGTTYYWSVVGGGGSGTVTTTGSPASGNLATFSGASSITNGNLSGDCTTSGTLAITCTETNGTAFGTFATQNYATPPAIGGTTPAAGSFTTLSASSTVSGTGFSTYLASPPAIGGTAPAPGTFNTLALSGNVSTAAALSGGIGLIGSATPTYNDSSGTGGTIATAYMYTVPPVTFTANTATTYTTEATLYVPATTCSTNTICSNNYGIATNGSLGLTGSGDKISMNSRLVAQATAVTVTSGLGTSPTVVGNTTLGFKITTGSSGTPSTTVVLGLPTATTGWRCTIDDITTPADTAHQTALATNSVTFTFSSAPTLSDVLVGGCTGI
jgi:hypothetical protein